MNFNQIIEHNYPFQHWEIIDCLDKKTLDEISFASIPDGERAYDGTRAADHSGEGKDGKLRLFITKDNAKSFPQLTKVINTLQEFETSQQMCDDILNKTGVALLPGSDFGFKKSRMLARLSYTDFDGDLFLKNISGSKKLDNDFIERYAPNIVEGTKKLSEWSKSL